MGKNFQYLLFSFFLSFSLFAQEKEGPKYIPDFLRSVEPYGTFQYALGGNWLGMAVVNLTPRMGLKGEWFFDENDNYFFLQLLRLA